MKRIITLVLAVALLMTSVGAIAENHPKPSSDYFAKMKVKISDTTISMSFSQPVDRLFVNWTDGLQELLINENLQASVLRKGHNYLPGILEHTSYAVSKQVYEGNELVYEEIEIEPLTGYEVVTEVTTYGNSQTLEYGDNTVYKIWLFEQKNPDSQYEIVEPKQVFVEGKDERGKTIQVPMTDEDGNFVYEDGYIRAYTVTKKYNNTCKIAMNIAIPEQTAFITIQEEWLVCYNRSGKIVAIEYYEGEYDEDL